MADSPRQPRNARVERDWRAFGILEGEAPSPDSQLGTRLAALVERLIASEEFTGSLGETLPIHGASDPEGQPVMLFGLGTAAAFGTGPAFAAGFALAKKLGTKPRGRIVVNAPETADADALASLMAGLIAGQTGPDLKKAKQARHPFATLELVQPGASTEAITNAMQRGEILGAAINLARRWANIPPAEKPPTRLAAATLVVARSAGFHAEVWDEARLQAERFGGLLGVAAGSDQPPTFVKLEWRNGGDSAPLALVGKGVTFDSGGLSLKSNESMLDMKADMTGAAVVLATFQAVARLGLPVNLLGFLPLTENLTGGRAMKLGDVLTMRDGTTVEVLNTDAEGRLILADALAYAVEQKPARIVDLATLTGACVVALGTKIAGLFSNDDGLASAIQRAAVRAGERVWRLPIDDDFGDLLKSHVADLKNVGGKYGGAITAAKFLQRFVGTTPWAHLDIAGPSWADTDHPTRDVGATGCYVRTLVAWIESHIAEARSKSSG